MKQETILLIDDEPVNLDIISNILSKDYKIKVATSASRALDILSKGKLPNLILLDVMMPEMSGYELMEIIQSSDKYKTIPVIFVTAMNDDKDEEAGLRLGAVDYVMKPIIPAILKVRVSNHLMLARARELLENQNQFLEREVQRRMIENENIQHVSIQALAHLAETRDPETGAHIIRTQSYVKVLVEDLFNNNCYKNVLTDENRKLFVQCAPLHDIGKVGIPDKVLLKPGKFTPEEWEIMKTHAEIGAKAIEDTAKEMEISIPFLEVAREIAGAHHEKWDGSGYPLGLSGQSIPLSARLMAIADVFDALISKRVYKDAISIDEACEIIISDSGIHFDPLIVESFQRCISDFVNIANKFKD